VLDIVDARTLQTDAFLRDVLAGLSRPRKTLPSRWLYDDAGCELFEQITQLAEYYPTRTEVSILRERIGEMAAFCGPEAVVLEYGAGAGIKTQLLLAALTTPRAYVPIDIAGAFLLNTAERLRGQFPQLEVWPVTADFTTAFEIPRGVPCRRRVVFFPGSTIGNLDAAEAQQFLRQARRHAGKGGAALIGVDLRKSLAVLLPAYDDALGVTAAFDLNLLARINRELGGDFELDGFRHEARWNEAESAVEMHLVSLRMQHAQIDGQRFAFAAGESIHTESSRKYELADFGATVARAGWRMTQQWQDAQGHFAVVGLEVN
jgi:dimethylhistidine N-methyltransferase